MTDDIERWLGAAPELMRVIVVAQEVRNPDGGRTIVGSVEVWNTMLVVRWSVVAPEALRHRDPSQPPRFWRCRDDLGNEYGPRAVAVAVVSGTGTGQRSSAHLSRGRRG